MRRSVCQWIIPITAVAFLMIFAPPRAFAQDNEVEIMQRRAGEETVHRENEAQIHHAARVEDYVYQDSLKQYEQSQPEDQRKIRIADEKERHANALKEIKDQEAIEAKRHADALAAIETLRKPSQ